MAAGGPRCTICDSPHRAAIDRALSTDTDSVRDIALRFGVGHMSVQRHKSHVSAALVEVARQQRVEHDIDTFNSLRLLYNRWHLAVKAADRELYDEATGEYRYDPQAVATMALASKQLVEVMERNADFLVMLHDLQASKQRDAAQEQEELGETFAGCPWSSILARGLEVIGVTNGTAEAAGEKMAAVVEAGLVAWLQDRG